MACRGLARLAGQCPGRGQARDCGDLPSTRQAGPGRTAGPGAGRSAQRGFAPATRSWGAGGRGSLHLAPGVRDLSVARQFRYRSCRFPFRPGTRPYTHLVDAIRLLR